MWYNEGNMKNNINTEKDYTLIQLKIQEGFEKIIEISDPIYSFNEIIKEIDLRKYFAIKDCRKGRPEYNRNKLLKVILFSFMENGYVSLRQIEKSCKTDLRYLWILDGEKAPSHMTIDNAMKELIGSVEEIFKDINKVIFEKEKVDLNHIYIDGTKIEANANKYTWVWKKSCITQRGNAFTRITQLLNEINENDLMFSTVKLGTRQEYSIEYLEQVLAEYAKLTQTDTTKFVHGKGKRKSIFQKHYERLAEYIKRLKEYAKHIRTCGDNRGSYSKTDNDATFMRVNKDYMKNDQLLPAYNVQVGVCDEYIAVVNIQQYASDMDCFIPLMESFNKIYGYYPKYPVADAGYGCFNNYLYCEEHGMEKYMKFTMYEKETKDETYRDNIFRPVNFARDKDGNLVCPNGKRFFYSHSLPVKGNKFGRTEEFYQCEDCTGCPYREKCHKSEKSRTIKVNEELTQFHQEVLNNLNCIHGALLKMNRSIQAEGTYGIIKQNKGYRRIRRKGLKAVTFEFMLISAGFNLYKYHLKKLKDAKLDAENVA